MSKPHEIEYICPKCGGMGFRSEHDPSDGSEEHMVYGKCTSCPIQVQCEECEGQGRILFTEVGKII